MEFIKAMEALGVNVTITLERFAQNESLWKRFVLKFIDDPTYESLSKAVGAESYMDIERDAHTLKGTSANLGFQRLSDICAQLVDCVRRKEYHEISEIWGLMKKEYEELIDGISVFL